MSMQIGIIGTGGFGRMHGDILSDMEDVEIKAVCGTSIEKGEKMASQYPGAKGYSSLRDTLDRIKLDAVYICVPPMAHGELEVELMERGIPFFVEKPIGADLDTPNRVFSKLKENPVITSVGYHFRYQQTVDKLKEILSYHTIGMITGRWNGNMPGVAWWKEEKTSGGQFVEQTTHIVDLVRYVAGEVAEVHAFFGDRVMKDTSSGVTVSDVGTVNLKLENGVVANISNTCILPAGVGEVGLSFYTDKGIIEWTPANIKVKTSGKEVIYHQSENPYELESRTFIEAVASQDDAKIRSDYADALKTQEVTWAALQSAKKNAVVS